MQGAMLAQINNDTLTLPVALQKRFAYGQVLIVPSGDDFVVKPVMSPSLTELAVEFKKAAKAVRLTKADAKAAVIQARKSVYAGRA